MNSSAAAAFAAACTSSAVASRFGVGYVVAHAVAEEKTSCCTRPICLRNDSCVIHGYRSRPAEFCRSELIKAQQKAGNGCFACSRSAHKGHSFTCCHAQRKVADNRSAVSIGKADVIKGDVTLAGRADLASGASTISGFSCSSS